VNIEARKQSLRKDNDHIIGMVANIKTKDLGTFLSVVQITQEPIEIMFMSIFLSLKRNLEGTLRNMRESIISTGLKTTIDQKILWFSGAIGNIFSIILKERKETGGVANG